jgi:hypothetical protein
VQISVNKNYSGYTPFAFRYKVTLDGVFLNNCVAADEEMGTVVCYRKDEHNNFVLDPETNNVILEVRNGKVVIIYTDSEQNHPKARRLF